jgi:hypothetical protein
MEATKTIWTKPQLQLLSVEETTLGGTNTPGVDGGNFS